MAALRANMDTVLSKMTDLEHRLTILETRVYTQPQKTNNETSFKNEVIMLLTKALIIGLTIIGSCSGVSSIISKMF